MKDKNSRLVYSSDQGRICPDCGKPAPACTCARRRELPGDGVVRIRRESKGRGGKTVTVITGLPLEDDALKTLVGELKRRCGTGGTVKGGTVEIQGDHADFLGADLQKRGFSVKRSGG